MPENILIDENVKAIIQALNPEGLKISESIISTVIYSRIDELPEPVIDLLAKQFHADFYDLAGTLEMKRETVKGSLQWHMKKGTEWSILKALSMIGVEGEFLHWKDTGDEPYSFRIRAKITGDFYRTKGRDKIIASIRRAVMESKAARSWFKGLDTRIGFRDESLIYAGLFDALTGFRILGLAKVEAPDKTQIYYGLANGVQGERKIKLSRESDKESRVYIGTAQIMNINHEIGVELGLMQELLMMFEKRIFERIDAQEKALKVELKNQENKMKANFEEIKEMLRWKGPDEE